MNYLAEIIAFERWCENNYLPISAQLLWYRLMYICNKTGWSEWVTVDNLRLMAAMQMGREATLISTRDELIKAGLIEYQKGRKGCPNRYHIISLEERQNGNTFKSEVESVVQSEVESVVQSEVESVVQSVDISKHKQKLKNKKKDTNVSKEKNQSDTKKFIPPTVDEVRAYCQERGNTIAPEYFVDFYASKGWIISGNHKMVDWKAAVRNWERNQVKWEKEKATTASSSGQKKAPNKFLDFAQRNTDYNQMVADYYGYQDAALYEGGKER